MVLSSFAGLVGAIAAFGELGVLFMYPALGAWASAVLFAFLIGSASA